VALKLFKQTSLAKAGKVQGRIAALEERVKNSKSQTSNAK